MASEEGISPWRNAKPRKPIDAFAKEMKTNSPLTVGESPPSSGYKESTRVGTSFEQSSSSMHESSQLELSGASPALLRSEERGGSKMRLTKVANFTKIRKEARNNSKTKKTKTKYSDDDPLSDDDQPSGNCYYVGESSNVSMSSTVNKTKTNRTNPDLTPPTPSKGSSVCACIWVVIVASISIVVMTVVRDSNWDSSSILSSSPSSSSSAEHWKQVRQSVSAELSSLKIQFPNQTKASWRVIGATLKSPLHPLPDYPGVLLVVSSRSQARTSSCLASKLVQTSSRALLSPAQPLPTTDSLIIRASDLTNLHPDTAKRQLTESLHTSLDTSSTAALLDLADLHPTAALTLHAFADNSNAPYKQAVLVLTLTGDLEMEQTGNCKLETRVERLLAGLWREELGVDKFSALISRIVVSVVELQPERPDICG